MPDLQEKRETARQLASELENKGNATYCLRLRADYFSEKSIMKMNNSEVSCAISLLEIIKNFPWIVDVAAHGFDNDIATGHMFMAVGKNMINKKVDQCQS